MVDCIKLAVNGKAIPVSGENLAAMIAAPKFQAHIANIDPRYMVRGLRVIENVLIPNGNLLFSFLDYNVSLASTPEAKHPGIVGVRGGSVAILVIITANETGSKFGVLLKQSRFPIGNPEFCEIPAGMLDESTKDFLGPAAKELYEETGIKIDPSQLVRLGKAYTSPGLLDEFIEYYLVEMAMPLEEILKMEGRLTGNMEEGESICVKVGPLFDIVEECETDGKSETAFLKYLRYRPEVMAEYSQYLLDRQPVLPALS